MAETENARKWPIFVLIVVVILIIIIGFVVWQFGTQGILTIVKWFLIIAIIFSILALIIFGIFWLFKRHKKEMVFIMRNNIINTCKVNTHPYPQELWLYGSEKPFPQPRKLGAIVGFAMIKSAIQKMYDPITRGLVQLEKPKDVVFCTFGRGGFIAKLLGQHSVFAGVYPDDFVSDTLNQPVVYIRDEGMSITPMLYQILWCAKHWQDKALIEETAKETIHRLLIESNLNELYEVIHKAVAVDVQEKEGESVGDKIGLGKTPLGQATK